MQASRWYGSRLSTTSHNIDSMRLKLYTILPLLIVALSSCHQRSLSSCDEATVVVHLDYNWDNISSDVNLPAGMSAIFYPIGTGQTWRYDIAGSNGGDIEITPGHYRLLTFNNDLEGVDYTDTYDYLLASVQCRQLAGSYLQSPGHVMTAHVDDITISPCGRISYAGKSNADNTITCYPVDASTVYDIVVEKITAPRSIRSVTCTLTGVATGVELWEINYSGPTSKVYSKMDGHDGKYTAVTTALGPAMWQPAGYNLDITVTLDNGESHLEKYDVTDQVNLAPTPLYIPLTIGPITINGGTAPDPDIGLGVAIDGWNTIDIYL